MISQKSLEPRTIHPLGLVLYAMGFLSMIIGGLFLTPLLYLLFDTSEVIYARFFLIPGLAALAAGGSVIFLFRGSRLELNPRNGSIIVVLAWVLASLLAVYPVRRLAGLNFTPGFFESGSGWTTTGLSVIDVSAVPKILLLWRSIMQLAGGAGLAIIMLAVFALPVGAGLYRAEGRNDQLVPHVLQSAKLVVLLYSIYAAVGIIALRLAGMDLFDAVNHSFCAISTGGFSTRAASIGHWESVLVEAATIPLMLLGSLNFVTAYALFRGKLRSIFRNGELRLAVFLMAAGIMAFFFMVTRNLYPVLDKEVRVAVFEAVTALTTTGYSTVVYTDWPSTGFLILFILMLVGGGSCSTAGGIKQLRVYLLFKSVLWEVRRALLPRQAVVRNYIYQGDEKVFVSEGMVRSAGIFFFLYLSLWLTGALVIAACGYPLKDALFEFASSIGTVGLSVGITGPEARPLVLWVEIVGMVLGRLELFVVFIAISGTIGELRRSFHR